MTFRIVDLMVNVLRSDLVSSDEIILCGLASQGPPQMPKPKPGPRPQPRPRRDAHQRSSNSTAGPTELTALRAELLRAVAAETPPP